MLIATAGPYARVGRESGDGSRQACLCAKAADRPRCMKRAFCARRARESETRHPNGKPGPLERRRASHQRVDRRRHHRPRARGTCLDQSARGLLAAGSAAPDRSCRRSRRPAVRQSVDVRSCAGRARGRHGQRRSRRPEGLDWDLYLGPLRENIPYHPVYHPFNWRGWLDFGLGALGDMGAHLIDHPFWALGLTYPTSIEATSTPWGTMPMPATDPRGGRPRRAAAHPVSYPVSTCVHYQFAARGTRRR